MSNFNRFAIIYTHLPTLLVSNYLTSDIFEHHSLRRLAVNTKIITWGLLPMTTCLLLRCRVEFHIFYCELIKDNNISQFSLWSCGDYWITLRYLLLVHHYLMQADWFRRLIVRVILIQFLQCIYSSERINSIKST